MIPLGVLASSYVAPAGGGGAYLDSYYASVTATTTHTFTSIDIGPASASRVVIVGIAVGNQHNGISAVTIGGVSATIAATSGNQSYTNDAIAYATVPTGTTADIAITVTAAQTRFHLSVWAEPTGITVDGTAQKNQTAAIISTTVTSAVDGTVIGVVCNRGQIAGKWSWTSPLIIRANYADYPRPSAADGIATATTTTVEATFSGGANYSRLVALAYTPA